MSTWERITRGLGIFTVALFLLVMLTPLSNLAGQSFAVAPERKAADAIVVLAAALLNGGSLSDESMRRTITGIELYKQGFAPVLVFSGRGRRDKPVPTEAGQRLLMAEAVGMPAEAILKEETANTTREEAGRISRLLMHRGLRKILLVTDSLHLRRAKLAFESTGLEVFPVPSDNFPTAATSAWDRLWLASRIVEESAALSYYRLAGYF